MAFSIIRNTRDLIKYNRNNDLNIFNGLKVVTMILVLFGHKFLYFVINPIMYGKRLERVIYILSERRKRTYCIVPPPPLQIYTEGPDFLLTCMNLVDPFFYIAGYLMYIMLIPQLSKPGTNWCQIPMIIAYKYLRYVHNNAISCIFIYICLLADI